MKFMWGVVVWSAVVQVFAADIQSLSSSSETIQSEADLISILERAQESYQGISPPSEDMFITEPDAYPVDWSGFSESTVKYLTAYMDEYGLPRYAVLLHEDVLTRERVITLASTGYELARYAAPDDYVPEAYYSSLLSKGAVYDDFTRWVFDPAHTAVEIELIPESLYSGYEMYEAQAAVSTMSVMMTSLDSIPMPGDTNSFTNVTGTASTSQSSTDVTMTFSLPEDFGNYAEIFKTTNLKYVPWSVAENRMSVTGGAYIAWTDAGSSNQPVGYYIFSDADLSEQTDSDSDGYTDLREIYISDTDPDEFDQVDDDNDGMMDFYEITFFGSTAPGPNGDYDEDGLSNAEEMEYDPGYPGYIDPSVTLHSNPADTDTDRDGMDDYLETVTYTFLDPNDSSDRDYDNDGLDNAVELSIGTDFEDYDTDGDSLPDGIEYEWGVTSPLYWNDVNADSDGDGLSLIEEYQHGSLPDSVDTDGDGVSDAVEASQGSDPADSADEGEAPDENDQVQLTIIVGDHSGSHSENYELVVTGNPGKRVPSGGYGEVSTNTYTFKRGESYTVTLLHRGTDPEHLADHGEADYDYTLRILAAAAGAQSQSASASVEGDDWLPGDPAELMPVSYTSSSSDGTSVLTGGIILEDPVGIDGWHGESSYFFADGEEMKFHPIGIEIECLDSGDLPKDRVRIGVCEKVKLTCKPEGLGDVTWSLSGEGGLISKPDDTAEFIAHDRASTPVITATCLGATNSTTLYVVEPSGVYQEQAGNTVHVQGEPSAGFNGVSYLLPMDVSFANIEINEGTCSAIATGCYASQDGKEHPAWSEWAPVSPGNAQKGCMVKGPNESADGTVYYDLVWITAGGAWQGYAGSFLWNIPWKFKSETGAEKEFATLVQFGQTEAGTGKTTISKGGVSVSAELNDPSCGSL